MRLEELVKEQALKEKELQLKFDLERFKIESGFRMQARMGQTSSVNSFSVTNCISRKYRVYTVRVGVWENLRTPETLVMEHWMEPEEEGDLVTEYV
ncbi:hypothetical protein TNCV_1297071 [Trichonephila clavipes]|uniref:Uncharacterized protein n=1 Tax=Trichonephila clavipes TaxID=2585209 RepID=A0A8X6VD67_TRICX|nr:hypothetical protein TNCV_1297071 [Trichonephila clavipes]